MSESKLERANVAERVTVALGELTWRFEDVVVVVHRVLPAVDIFQDDEHVVTAPLAATCIEWKRTGGRAGFEAGGE